jgi:uncharacterized protein (TIGR03067 family)
MRFKVLALALLFTAGAAAHPGDGKSDLDRLQGDWKVKGAFSDGKPAPIPPNVDQLVLSFQGAKVTSSNTTGANTFKVDEMKKPKQIDVVSAEGGVLYRGVYELTGDTLRMAFLENEERPASLDGRGVKGLTFQRVVKK